MSSRCSPVVFKSYVSRVTIKCQHNNSFIFLIFLYIVEVLKKIDIPSVFIGETSANSLKEEFTYEKG